MLFTTKDDARVEFKWSRLVNNNDRFFVHVLTLSVGDYNFLFSKHPKEGLSFYPQRFELKEIAKR